MVTSNSSDAPDDLQLAQAGDSRAFARIVGLHAKTMWLSARALCRDEHEAEDLAQETFVEAWKSLSRFDGRCQITTWLFGILRHRFLKSRRKPRPLPSSDDVECANPRASAALSPEKQAQQSEDAERLRHLLHELSDQHRVILELRFLAGATLEEIATLIDCPLGTVKSRLHHALEKLRRARFAVNLFDDHGESQASD